ncbi:TPA: hypothetical protein ACGOX6_001118 [Streptococcus suis]
MCKNIISNDIYKGVVKFGEDLDNGPSTIMLLGKQKRVQLDFGLLRFYRVLSRDLFSETFYPKHLIDTFVHSGQSDGLFIVEDPFLINFVKYRASGMADWFHLRHYIIITSNIVIDIITEESCKPIVTEYTV